METSELDRSLRLTESGEGLCWLVHMGTGVYRKQVHLKPERLENVLDGACRKSGLGRKEISQHLVAAQWL